jgi:hypothetical protein
MSWPRERLPLRWAAAFATAALAAGVCTGGCDSTSSASAEGVPCSTDSDCTVGLECLAYYVMADGGCASLGNECLQPCQVNSDCASGPSQGLGLVCQTVCGALPACEEPPPPIDAGADVVNDAPTDATAD